MLSMSGWRTTSIAGTEQDSERCSHTKNDAYYPPQPDVKYVGVMGNSNLCLWEQIRRTTDKAARAATAL